MHVPARVIRPLRVHTTHLASAPLPTDPAPSRRTFLGASRNHANGEAIEKEHVALVFGDVARRAAFADPRPLGVPHGRSVRVAQVRLQGAARLRNGGDCPQGRRCGAVLAARRTGIGLANKIRAYDLQARRGADTVDANRILGLPDDARRYDVAADMLEFLGVESVRLMTNNPAKVDGLRELGVEVTGRIPIVVPTSAMAAKYVETKRRRMGHEVARTHEVAQQAIKLGHPQLKP